MKISDILSGYLAHKSMHLKHKILTSYIESDK